jgi:hypothetical protein
LEQATKSKIYLIKKLDKSKEDIEDLKFQVSLLRPRTVSVDPINLFVSFFFADMSG